MPPCLAPQDLAGGSPRGCCTASVALCKLQAASAAHCTDGTLASDSGLPGHPAIESKGASVHLQATIIMKFPILKFPFAPESFLAVILCVTTWGFNVFQQTHKKFKKLECFTQRWLVCRLYIYITMEKGMCGKSIKSTKLIQGRASGQWYN